MAPTPKSAPIPSAAAALSRVFGYMGESWPLAQRPTIHPAVGETLTQQGPGR